jgi:hypothetical protein
MANGNTQALAAQLSAANYKASDLSNLARNVYVRCLFKVHAMSGRNNSAKGIALEITAKVMQQKVGFHFTPAEVQDLMDKG